MEYQDMMKSATRKIGDATVCIIFMLCIWSGVTDCQMAPSLDDYTPKSGPIAGGTEINVTGEGFITTGAGRSKCKFERSLRGATLSEQNILHNETFLTCYLPAIEYLTNSELQGGEMVRFTITGVPGSDSNSLEFFLYDLEQIQVRSISPTEGLVNSTNITLSIAGENFLNTNEITCSVAGSYKVPAQYINSSILQCQLAPFPETARVNIDVSMNGQAVANIAPLKNNSATFTYFASPPRIQSCRFTLSYAQLLLSFDREVEIGGEQRAADDTAPTSSALFCNEIYTQESLENVIGLDSICFWYNAQQREVVVQLSSDTSVELGSQITIRNDTIRTRYVQYSRLASENAVVSLPETDSPQFLPMAIIEAPSIIPYCGNFTVSGEKSQYGGSRALQYMWIIGTLYDENGTLIQDRILADHVPTGFTSQSVLELSSDLFNPDLLGSGSGSGVPLTLASSFDIQLHVRNFLGFTSTARVTNITRAEIAQPSVLIVGGDSRRVGISDETILEARVVLQSDACLIPIQDLNEPVTYTWRVIDESGRAINIDDTSHSTVLVLPPYSLELGSEYMAILSVDFNSIIFEASTTLTTDTELFNLIARISGGVRRSVSTSEDILLDGLQSQYVNTSSLVLDVTWRCATIASNEELECIGQDGQALSFSTNNLVQIIPSGTLQPGEYNFSLTLCLMSDSQDSVMLEATVYQVVIIFPFLVPRIEIIQTDSIGADLESVLVHNELILNVGVQSNFPGIGQWTSEYVIGYAQLDLNDAITRSPLRYNITNVNSQRPNFSDTMPLLFTNTSYANSFVNQIRFIIAGNTLLTQNTYRFKFTTYNEFDISGFAEVDIHTESVPTSGRIIISPQNGSPLTTIFSLSAPGWTDNFGDTPLLYQFGLRYNFFNSMESSNSGQQLLPSCCNLVNDNSINTLENVSCVCKFFSTGVSERNDIQTMLPFLPQTRNRVVQAELLVHVFDKNGARTEATQTLDNVFTEPVTDDDSTQLLRPMLDSPSREQLDIQAMLDRIRQLSQSNWRDALVQLTTLVSFAEVSSFNSPYFNPSQAQIVQFKMKATEIVLDIYESYIPLSKPYLSVIANLLQSTTNSLNMLNDELTLRIIAFVRVLIVSYNDFDREKVFSLPGFSTTESQIVLKILQNLMSTSESGNSDSIMRIQANSITQELLTVIPKLGFGLCASERHSFVSGDSVSWLKASQTNLPTSYQSIEQCNARQANSRKTKYCLSEDRPKVTVNFSSALFERYLWWPCAAAIESSNAESELYCSGVCLTSAQHTQNLLWQGSEYDARLKSLLFQLYLLNPQNGSILETSASMVAPTRVARNVAADSQQVDLVFPILASYSNASNLQCAYWNGTSRMWIRRTQFTGEMKHRNDTVTDVICQFGVTLGSIFTVLEVCPDGYYGEACSNICPEGLWGEECQGSCDCSNRGNCSPVDGSCDCNPGWMGDNCAMKCPTGVWGKGCLEVCLCENGADCSHITGACTCTETPGWMGMYCNISCPSGLFGSNCMESCTCNKDEECNKMTGFCNCSAGFTGPTCHQSCPNGSYGLGCVSQCQCFMTGTRSCHHVNGSCDCLDSWTGELCEVEVTPPPEPIFQIWWAVVGVVVAVLLAVLVVCLIIVFVVVRKKKRKKVLPITDDETGDHVPHHKGAVGDEVATDVSGSSGSDLNITRAKSLEVLIPKGKELIDIFINHTDKKADGEEEESDFKEPAELNGKLRWQIIRLIPAKSKSPSSVGEVKDTPPPPVDRAEDPDKKTAEEVEDLVKKEVDGDSSLEVSKITQESPRSKYSGDPPRSESADDHMTEILYKRGVYLTLDATLKDLRNGFIELEKLENNDRYFQLLKSDVPGDFIEIDTEDETLLSQIERRLVQPRTMYIENIDPATVTMELCVCGKFADLECSECGLRGYCSFDCQQDDWFKHAMICQEKIEERKQRKKSKSSKSKKKKKHKKHKKHKKSKSRASTSFTPSIDVCICGKEAEFECSRCEKQGYCSEECQLKDWIAHQMYCTEQSDHDTQPGSGDELQHENSDDASSRNSKEKNVTNSEDGPFNRSGLETVAEETEESDEDK